MSQSVNFGGFFWNYSRSYIILRICLPKRQRSTVKSKPLCRIFLRKTKIICFYFPQDFKIIFCINFTDTVFILNYECYGSTKFCAYIGKSQNCKPCLLSYPIPWESQFSFTSEQKKNVLLKCNSEVIKTASGAAGSQHLRCILWDTGATLIFVCVWCPSHVQISITSTLICLVWGRPFPWVYTCYYSFLLFKSLLTQGFPFTLHDICLWHVVLEVDIAGKMLKPFLFMRWKERNIIFKNHSNSYW